MPGGDETGRRPREAGALTLIASLAACFVVAGREGNWTSLGLGPWYDGLVKPGSMPPNALFGPVWTTLDVLKAVAAWQAWRVRERPGARPALALDAIRLALNLAWPGLFFGPRLVGPGLVEIAALWLAIAATVVAFARVRRSSGLLLVPYQAWVSYATALNFALWRWNG
jgi:translocator protein